MTVSAQFREAVFAQQTDDGALILLTLDHDVLQDPIRVALNTEDVVSRGETFQAYPFHVQRPAFSSDRPPRAQISIDNVDRQITEALRSIQTGAMDVMIETVSFSDPDTVEEALDGFKLTNVTINVQSVTGDLGLEDLVGEPYPNGRFDPARFRGGF